MGLFGELFFFWLVSGGLGLLLGRFFFGLSGFFWLIGALLLFLLFIEGGLGFQTNPRKRHQAVGGNRDPRNRKRKVTLQISIIVVYAGILGNWIFDWLTKNKPIINSEAEILPHPRIRTQTGRIFQKTRAAADSSGNVLKNWGRGIFNEPNIDC